MEVANIVCQANHSCYFLAGIHDDLGGEMHFFLPPAKPDPLQVNFVPLSLGHHIEMHLWQLLSSQGVA